MARIRLSDNAACDQADILRMLADVAGPRTVLKYQKRFHDVYLRLAEHPASGPRRESFGKNIRIGIVSPYVVVYTFDAEADLVEIIRIIDGRRNIAADLLEPFPNS